MLSVWNCLILYGESASETYHEPDEFVSDPKPLFFKDEFGYSFIVNF
jgi:hypothetical protein